MTRPMPVPSTAVLRPKPLEGVNSRSCCSTGMPRPVSQTSRRTVAAPPAAGGGGPARRPTRPPGTLYFTALVSRLTSTWRRRIGRPRRGRFRFPAGKVNVHRAPLGGVTHQRHGLLQDGAHDHGGGGQLQPAGFRSARCRALVNEAEQVRPPFRMCSTLSRCATVSASSSRSWPNPRMALRGVLRLVAHARRNSLFARLARSASRRAASMAPAPGAGQWPPPARWPPLAGTPRPPSSRGDPVVVHGEQAEKSRSPLAGPSVRRATTTGHGGAEPPLARFGGRLKTGFGVKVRADDGPVVAQEVTGARVVAARAGDGLANHLRRPAEHGAVTHGAVLRVSLDDGAEGNFQRAGDQVRGFPQEGLQPVLAVQLQGPAAQVGHGGLLAGAVLDPALGPLALGGVAGDPDEPATRPAWSRRGVMAI